MTNTYGTTSTKRLNECHEDLQIIFKTVLPAWDNTILTGYRDKEEQTKKFESGESKVEWPHSKHNSQPSMAADVSPYPIPEKWGDDDRNEYEKFRYFAFYVLGVANTLYTEGVINNRLRWGGDWDGDKDVNDQDFNDLVHFELITD